MDTGILPPELKSVEQLFTPDAVFSVPLYQRNFAWGPDEVEELWEDLLSALERHSDYFLGTIVLQRTEQATFEIIDGQQRLACLSMLFSAIRNLFLANEDSRSEQIFLGFLGARDFTRNAQPRPKLVLNRINNETFVQFIVNNSSLEQVAEALKAKPLHESNRLLLQAYKFYFDKVTTRVAKGTEAEGFIVPLINSLRSSIKFITIPVASPEDAHLFFESFNARGKELAISDLVKNRLYLEAGQQLQRAQQLWEQMENQLARRPIPEYLRHFWIAKKAEPKAQIVREKNLYRAIGTYVKGKEAATLELLADLFESAHNYVAISDYVLWPDDPAFGLDFEENLRELQLFRVTQCHPLLLNVIQNFKNPKEIAKTFRIVANFSFRYFIIGNQSPGNLERESVRIAHGVREGTIASPKGIAKAFLDINPDREFRSDFTFATISASSPSIARYLLAKISNHTSRALGNAELVVNPNSKAVTLEHVLPLGYGPEWKTAFSKGVDPNDYVQRIGNLTLLTQKLNSEAANKTFSDKKKIALNRSDLPINKMFSEYTTWCEADIEKRQSELAKIALEVWKLQG